LQSDTCSLEIPELKLEVGPNALSGRFSTVEGLLLAMKDQLLGHCASWGDSETSESKERYEKFLDDMDKALKAEIPCTLILDDPAGNSYIQVAIHICGMSF
jgi:zinc finger protein